MEDKMPATPKTPEGMRPPRETPQTETPMDKRKSSSKKGGRKTRKRRRTHKKRR